jgi:hypothetical protein
MAYEDFAALVEAHAQQIAQEMAAHVIATAPNADRLDAKQIEATFVQGISVLATYLRDGDPEPFKQFFVQIGGNSFQAGGDVDSFRSTGQIFTQKLKELVEHEYAGPANERVRESYKRRLDSLNTLTNVTIINTHIAKRNESE